MNKKKWKEVKYFSNNQNGKEIRSKRIVKKKKQQEELLVLILHITLI